MPTDDEFRRVAEDVRALARSLARDVREADDRARTDPSAAGRAARDELRQARSEWRGARWSHRHHGRCGPPWWPGPHIEGDPPRWDSWGQGRYRETPTDPTLASSQTPTHQPRPPRPAKPPRARPPAPRHRHDGTTLIGLLAVVFGVAWLFAGTHLVDVSNEAVLAIALMVLGAALVVTARTDWALSRRRWPVLLGAGLLVAVIASSSSVALPQGLRNLQLGSQRLSYRNWSDLPRSINGGIGSTRIDLSHLPGPPPQPVTLRVTGGVGSLLIALAADVHVLVDAHIGIGSLTIDGNPTVGGFGQRRQDQLNRQASGPPLRLIVQSGLGSVRITDLLQPAGEASTPPPSVTPPAGAAP